MGLTFNPLTSQLDFTGNTRAIASHVSVEFTGTTYTLTHNFGAYPNVQVLDSTNEVLIPLSIVNNSVNDLTVTLSASGTYTIIATVGTAQVIGYTTTAVDYTALPTDTIIEVTASGKTITLPTSEVTKAGFAYQIDNSSSGNITVVGETGETIQGLSSQTVPPDSCMDLYANGTNWRIN